MSLFINLIEWTKTTFLPLGSLGLFIIAFMESSFFPVPPDILLIVLVLAKPQEALWFALVCTVGSILGALLGYAIGYYGGKPLALKFFKSRNIEKVHKMFNKYEEWAIGIAGFTPIPYKIFTIAGGIFYVNIWKFIIASVLSRGARFFLESILLMIYGEFIVNTLDKYFGILTLAIALGILVIYIFYKRTKNKSTKKK